MLGGPGGEELWGQQQFGFTEHGVLHALADLVGVAAAPVRANATPVWNAPCRLWLRTSPRNNAPPGASNSTAVSMTSAR